MTLTPLLNLNLLFRAEVETLNEEMIAQSSPATVEKRKRQVHHDHLPHAIYTEDRHTDEAYILQNRLRIQLNKLFP